MGNGVGKVVHSLAMDSPGRAGVTRTRVLLADVGVEERRVDFSLGWLGREK